MTTDELLRRLRVGKTPVLALLQPLSGMDGWYVFVELQSMSEVEVRFQGSGNEEGGVSFFGTYSDAASMLADLASHFGPIETWSTCEPTWKPEFEQSMVDAMRARIRAKTLPLPSGVDATSDDPFWSA